MITKFAKEIFIDIQNMFKIGEDKTVSKNQQLLCENDFVKKDIELQEVTEE